MFQQNKIVILVIIAVTAIISFVAPLIIAMEERLENIADNLFTEMIGAAFIFLVVSTFWENPQAKTKKVEDILRDLLNDNPKIVTNACKQAFDDGLFEDGSFAGKGLVNVNLSDENLTRADFRKTNLKESKLKGTKLSETDMAEATLTGADLSDAKVLNSNLIDAKLNVAICIGTDFSESNMWSVDFEGADLTNAVLRHCGLEGAKNLENATFQNTTLPDGQVYNQTPQNLEQYTTPGESFWLGFRLAGKKRSGEDYTRGNFLNANGRGIDFSDCTLDDTNFRGADLTDAIFFGADLSDADLSNAILVGTDLRECKLKKVNLCGADLTNANLMGSNLYKAIFDEETIYNSTILPDGTENNGDIDMSQYTGK